MNNVIAYASMLAVGVLSQTVEPIAVLETGMVKARTAYFDESVFTEHMFVEAMLVIDDPKPASVDCKVRVSAESISMQSGRTTYTWMIAGDALVLTIGLEGSDELIYTNLTDQLNWFKGENVPFTP